MIYCNLKRGLGNMMFQILATKSFAHDRGVDCSFPNLFNLLSYLNLEKTFNPNLNHSHEYLKFLTLFKNLNTSPPYKEMKLFDFPFEYCVFVPKFNNRLELYVNSIPKDWEMMYFGGNHNYHIGNKTEKINEHCIKLSNTYSAHCVILKDYVFEELIENLKTFKIENDVMMANLQKKYKAYLPVNKLTSQIPSYSDIEQRFVDYNWLIK